MTDQELELLLAEEEAYVQVWRESLTQKQINTI
jgi:hypothetical protein